MLTKEDQKCYESSDERRNNGDNEHEDYQDML